MLIVNINRSVGPNTCYRTRTHLSSVYTSAAVSSRHLDICACPT